MKVQDFCFTDYYQKYITIEADDLTEQLKDNIRVHNDDCYALCSSYCDETGYLMFNVLSIGKTWETCTRGLGFKRMLGSFAADEVLDREARIVDADFGMIRKNTPFIEKMNAYVDEDLRMLRADAKLDDIRNLCYPDIVMTGILTDERIDEYAVRLTGFKGPFVVGELVEDPDEDSGVMIDDTVYALPYIIQGECRLLALFAGERLSEDEQEIMDQIVQETGRLGIDFRGINLRN